MKKSLLALAALTAFAGAASAQSSVTLYGRVDLSVVKGIGSDAKNIANGSGSRLGLRGTEDLGGGLSALFNIEHRFNADTGADSTGNVRFWNGRSLVGLQGGFGQVVFGREYTTAFLGTQLIADPWGWDTVAAQNGITGLGGIAKVRNDSSVTYKIAAAGFSFGAQIAEATDTINNFAVQARQLQRRLRRRPADRGLRLREDRPRSRWREREDVVGHGQLQPGLHEAWLLLRQGHRPERR